MALDSIDTSLPVPSAQPAHRIPDEVYKLMSELGSALIQDDKRDLFRTVYRHRPNYKYHGKVSKHHDSPVHHWMGGTLLVLLSQLGILHNTAMEAQEVAREMEGDGDEHMW